jgi:hypothetical protein
MIYAPTGTTGITVGATGHAHQAERELGAGEHFAVDCPTCEPLILGTKTGWASDVTSVALTPDERAIYEQQEKVGQRAQAIASRALAERLGDLIRTDGMVAAPVDPVQDVIGKLAALSQDQLATLRGIFAADQAEAAASKRAPGRPKKTDSE